MTRPPHIPAAPEPDAPKPPEGYAAWYASYDPRALDVPAPPMFAGDPVPPEPAPGAVPEFDPRYRRPLEGLLYVGALTTTVHFLGHVIVLRTLRQAEVLTIADVIRDFSGTIAEAKAYTAAVVSMAVVSVDSQDLPMPLGEGPDTVSWARQRFDYVVGNWYPTTLDALYNAYLELDEQVEKVVDAMGKASGQGGSTPGWNGP